MVEIPEEAVQAALDTWLDHEFDGTLNYPRMRNALTAAAPHLAAVRVKKLEWKTERADKMNGVDTERNGFHEFGYYSITGKSSGCFVSTFDNMGRMQHVGHHGFASIEAAKAAAQADYEARILSAVEASPRAQALEEATLERSIERWRGMKPSEVMKGSTAQITYALEDARKDILTLYSALSSQPVADGWLPIETVEKDVPILIYHHKENQWRGKIHIAYAHSDFNGHKHVITEDGPCGWIIHPKPTHWRPLPASPGASE